MRRTNRSRFRMISSGMFHVHGKARVTKLSDLWHASQDFHMDFFRWLVEYDVTWHPVNAWKNNAPLAIWGYSAEAISWIGMYLKSLPVRNAIQSCTMCGKPWKWATASTTTLCINCSYHNRLETAVHGVFDTKKHPGVCLFMWAWL